jgi:hypothetical protein
MWPIEYTQEYEDWFSFQEEKNKIAINTRVIGVNYWASILN